MHVDRTPSGDIVIQARFDGTPLAVRGALLDLRKVLHGTAAEHCLLWEIVLAEALNNVVEHAYRDITDGQIQLYVTLSGRNFHVTVKDTGAEMPGGSVPFHPEPQIDQLPEGGFGWGLIHKSVENLSYRRHAGENILRFDLHLDANDPA